MSGAQKDYTKLIRQVRRNGYVVVLRGSGHYAIQNREGQILASLPASASDQRAIKNTIAVLRRNNIDFEPKAGKSRRKKPKRGEN